MSPEAEEGGPGKEERLAFLLAAFDEALKGGTSIDEPKSAADVPADAQPDFKRAVACLRLLQEVWPRCPPPQDTLLTSAPAHPLSPPRQLGRFAIRRELGRGGFGTVYLAHDPQLGREVALKVPHAEVLADAGLRGRFQQEGRAAAALAHPNLVPVYEAGEADGVAYIALAYCPGVNLGDWLRQRGEPVGCRDAATLLATLAAAVHHAHTHGIVHRDLKPANVLLQRKARGANLTPRADAEPGPGEADALGCELGELEPKVTDFGLARQLDGGAGPTRTGTVLGTPSYMAPEQSGVRGPAVGPAADVYSLGAVLYHALTGRPPFLGETGVDTLHQVRFQDPIPPRRLRPGVPHDLQTICLKCLEKDPARRYPTALALADDLQRYCDGKPVLARPVGLVGRAARWGRRKPAVAGLLAALLVVLLAGFAGVAWQWRRAARNATQAREVAVQLERENRRAVRERQRAERHLRQARELVAQLTKLALEIGMLPDMKVTPGLQLLEKALAQYQQFLADTGTDPGVRREAARTCRLLGWYRFSLGQYRGADRAYRQAIDLLKGLLADDRENPDHRYQLGLCRLHHANTFREWGRAAEARKSYEQAIALGERLRQRRPEARYSVLLANALLNSTTVLPGAELAERLRRLRRALDLTTAAANAFPRDRYFQEEKALCLDAFGMMLFRTTPQRGGAEYHVREGLAIRKKLCDSGYGGRPASRYLADSHLNLARVLAHVSPAEAEREYRAGIALLQKLVADYSLGPYFRRFLADAQFELADHLAPASGRWAEVERLSREALAHYGLLVTAYPKLPGFADRHARRCLLLADQLLSRSRHDDAAELYRKALARLPADPAANNGLAWILATHPDPKRRDPGQAVQRARNAVRAAPKVATYHNTLGAAHYRAGNWTAAVKSLGESMRRGGDTANDWFFLAMACWRVGEREPARAWYEKAEQWRRKEKPKDAELLRLRAEAEAVLAEKPGP
jgi:tetratricopeptide (TPR) repeat protein